MDLDSNQARRLMAALVKDDLADGPSEGGSPSPGQLAPGNFGRYRLLRFIGSGGMGEVYEAEQDNPKRRVALKVIRADVLSPEAAARFEHEAKILGRLQHPGIARIYEAGRDAALGVMMPYFAMEFVDGRPLLDYIRHNHLDVRSILDVFVRTCEAVEHAHRMGVIHRDLKPANILVSSSGQPLVLDFGVARVTESDVQATMFKTDLGQLVGTVAYMSPEQISQDTEGLDTRSDVYALGVVLYEMLTGRPPYLIESARIYEAARIIKEVQPEPLVTVDRSLRGDIQTIVSKALAKERHRRYQSAGELAADIRRFLRDEPIEARPPSATYQLVKFAHRNPALIMALGLAVFALLALSGAAIGFAMHEAATSRGLADLSQKAEAARALAESRATEAAKQARWAEATLGFLDKMFMATSPALTDGRPTTVGELLDYAAQESMDEEVWDERTRAAAHFAVGKAFTRIGQSERAVELLTMAVDEYRRLLGEDDPGTLTCMSELAGALYDTDQIDESVRFYEKVLAVRTRTLGRKHPATVRSIGNLGNALHDLGREKEANELLEELAPLVDASAPLDRNELLTLHNLSLLRLRQQRYVEAEQLVNRVIQGRRALLGLTHGTTLASEQILAGALAAQGKVAEAVETMRRVVDAYRSTQGPDHPQTLLAMYNLSGYLLEAGDYDEAERAGRTVLEARIRLLGRANRQTIMSASVTAQVLAAKGEFDAAISLLQEASDGIPEDDVMLRPFRGILRRMIGENHVRAERYAEAEQDYLAALETLREVSEPEDRQVLITIQCLVELCDLLHDEAKASEYRSMLRSESKSPGASTR